MVATLGKGAPAYATVKRWEAEFNARWVPKLPTVDQKHTRQNISRANLKIFEADPNKFLLSFVPIDETQNPNNSLKNGSVLAHPAKEGKDCSVSCKDCGFGCMGC